MRKYLITVFDVEEGFAEVFNLHWGKVFVADPLTEKGDAFGQASFRIETSRFDIYDILLLAGNVSRVIEPRASCGVTNMTEVFPGV